jgi:hypothetical protein
MSPSPNLHARLEISIPQLGAFGVYEGTLPKPGQVYEVFPRMQYRYDLLLRQSQTTPAGVTFKLYLDGKFYGQGPQALQVRSVNDCPASYTDAYGKKHLIRWMAAAYVNEDHPWIDQLLREGLDTKAVNSFTGYLKSPPEAVLKQVFAIWEAFQRRGFRYSTISVNPTTDTAQRVRNQHIRFLDESVKTSEANCVDGSVLFASVLRKIHIAPFLVFIPGHCFLGFYLDPEHKQRAFLETTMMGNTDLTKYPEEVGADRGVPAGSAGLAKSRASYGAYVKAVQRGAEEYRQNEPTLVAGDSPDHQVVDIVQARKMGVMPIARVLPGR